MTHWKKWIWATQQLSTHIKHTLKVNLNANKIQWHMCQMCGRLIWMLMNYKWMTGREASCGLPHESVVRQSGKPASQTSLLSSGWPSDQPDWFVWPDTLFFFKAMICILIGGTKCLQSVVGSASDWDVRGRSCEHDQGSVELWQTAHGMAVKHRDKNTQTHTQRQV